jgi:ketosteroid isomerase-like protein
VPDAPGVANEARARSVVGAFLENNGAKMLAHDLRAPGFRWWLTGAGYQNIDDYMAKMMSLMKGRPRVTPVSAETAIRGMTVTGGRVAVELVRNIIYPDYDYINRFLIVMIVQDGKILEMREHNDIAGAIRGGLPVTEALS